MTRYGPNDGWVGRLFAPLYGKGGHAFQGRGDSDVIYAPDLDFAFKLARVQWPSADGWICLGAWEDEP